MNIRKFTGATSRDALRLVREALGADAVVLSNRTLDDGSVEITALADAELAAITPPAAAPGHPAITVQPAALPGFAPRTRAVANPYAMGDGGLPDVFSSMFGASAEADGASMVASGSAGTPDDEALAAASLAAGLPAAGSLAAGSPAAASPAAGSPAAASPAAPSEPAPWLVEHA
ncbi:flagellar biosynthesis protein FlhF, partial [Burkholderia sp. Ac-20353]|nr:flagellar biosynthesis protein FlhF [Burkholderia sp. Ac-20353]